MSLLLLFACAPEDDATCYQGDEAATVDVTVLADRDDVATSSLRVWSESCLGDETGVLRGEIGDTFTVGTTWVGRSTLRAGGAWNNGAASDTGGAGGTCSGEMDLDIAVGEHAELTMTVTCAADWME
jgi:hypothetical protein